MAVSYRPIADDSGCIFKYDLAGNTSFVVSRNGTQYCFARQSIVQQDINILCSAAIAMSAKSYLSDIVHYSVLVFSGMPSGTILVFVFAMQEYGKNEILKSTVIFYRKNTGRKEMELQKTIEETLEDNKLEICRTSPDLFAKLRSTKRNRMIVILVIADENDFRGILTFKPLLDDTCIVLVLPDANDEMVAMGHSIHPRFVSYIDSNFQEVAAVLKKIEKPRVLTDAETIVS